MFKIINHNDIIGKKFGKWTILSLSKPRYRKGGHIILYYDCLCVCGTKREVYRNNLISNISSNCGCSSKEWNIAHSGEKSVSWKGGRFVDTYGYVQIYLKSHPFCKSNGYIREHRVIMEKKIGRYLIKGENVHHIDGNRQNNKPENLELWNVSQPAGQRVEDKLKWAKEIIKIYG